MRLRPVPALLTLGALLVAGCTSAPRPAPATVAHVDLERYSGRWYVISHVPYFLEKGKVATYDAYARRPDGKLTNDFTFRKGSFDARENTWHGTAEVVDPTTNATWKVRFIWPLSATYKVFALDPDYRWAVVGNGDASLLWVLARERQLDPAVYERALAEVRAKGIATDPLARVPQPAN
ncbi:MAG: lipocalin family protein [Verrucomicrobia bacterium]|nr:lipocalin family protein [Verrucomicrobiota bacterium]